jgi:hypothetical protein
MGTKDDDLMLDDELKELLAEGEGDEDFVVEEDEEGEGDEGDDEIEGGKKEDEVPADDPPPAKEEPPAPKQQEHPGLKKQEPSLAERFGIPADVKEKLEGIERALEKVESDWDAGDIGDAEFKKQIAQLNTQRAEIAARVEAARIFEQQRKDAAKADDDAKWASSVSAFKAANPALWADEHRARFNSHVGFVTAPNGPYASLSFDQQLTLAAKNYRSEREALGLEAPDVVVPGAKKGSRDIADPGKRPPLPQTLARTPAAAINGNDDGRFSALDRSIESNDVDGSEAEFSRLTPAQQEEWLNRA